MQKILIGLLTLTTVGLGILCAMQARQLRATRDAGRVAEEARSVEVEARQSEAARIKELERVNERLDRQVQQFATVTTQLRTNEAHQSSNLTAMVERIRAAQKPGGGAGEEKDGVSGKGMGEMIGKMMKDPAMREMLREQQKVMINMMYNGLFKDMKLSPEEKDKLKGLLTDAQMKNVEAAQGLFGGDTKDGAAADATKQIADAKKQTNADIKELLGDERYVQFEDYQKTMSERMQLDQFKTQLTGENLALRDEQSAQMMQIMKEEKAAVPPAIPDDQTQAPKKENFTSEKLDQQLKWMDDYNRRVLDRAGQVLSPEQLTKYQSFQEQQASMQKLGLQMVRSMFGGEKAGAAPAPPLK